MKFHVFIDAYVEAENIDDLHVKMATHFLNVIQDFDPPCPSIYLPPSTVDIHGVNEEAEEG